MIMRDYSEKIKNRFNRIAEDYHERTKDHIKIILEYMEYFAKLLPPHAKILDVGCGTGRDAKAFTDMGFEIVGIDFSERMIELAKKIAPKAEFELMDFRELKFKNESFDAIWFNAAFFKIKKDEADKVLSEVYRVLKCGGFIYVSVKSGETEGFDVVNGEEKFRSLYTEEKIISVMEKNKFKIIKTEIDKKVKCDHWFINVFYKK